MIESKTTVSHIGRLRQFMVASAIFVLGVVVPEMGWMTSNTVAWLFALAVTVCVWWLLTTNKAQQVMQKWKWLEPKHTQDTFVIVACLVFFIAIGLGLTIIEKGHEDRQQLRTASEALVADITQFVADRTLSEPNMSMATDTESINQWMQNARQYDDQTDYLFVSKYQQRVTDVGYELRRLKIITDDELQTLSFSNDPEYPVISWVLEALQEYNSRLK